MNMKIMYGLLAICVIVICAVGFLGSITNKYGGNINLTGFNSSTERIEMINRNANETFNYIYGEEVDPDATTALGTVLRVGIGGIRMIKNTIILFPTVMIEAIKVFTTQVIPLGSATSWIVMSFLTIFFIAAVIWIISLLLRWYVG